MHLLQRTIIYAIGNFGAKGINMLLVPLFTIYLTKAEIGKYDLTLVTSLLLIPLLSLQLSDSAFRWLITEKGKKNRGIIISNITSYYVLSVAFLITAFFVFPTNFTLPQLLFVLSQLIYLLVLQVARGLSFTRLYAFSGLISSTLIASLSLTGLKYFNLKIDGLLTIAGFSYTVAFIYVAKKISFFSYFDISLLSKSEFKNYIRYSISLVPNALAWWGISLGARYLIYIKLGIVANGLYAISAKLPTLLTIITSFFTLAWQEDYIENPNNNTNRTSVIFRKYYTLLLSSLYILIPFSYMLLSAIVPPSFFESWKYTYFLFLAASFQALSAFLGADYLKEKKTKKIFITTSIAMIITLFISLGLIGRYGLYGVSFSTFIGMLAMFIIRAYDLKLLRITDMLKISLLILISFLENLSLLLTSVHYLFVFFVGLLLFLFFNKDLLIMLHTRIKKVKG